MAYFRMAKSLAQNTHRHIIRRSLKTLSRSSKNSWQGTMSMMSSRRSTITENRGFNRSNESCARHKRLLTRHRLESMTWRKGLKEAQKKLEITEEEGRVNKERMEDLTKISVMSKKSFTALQKSSNRRIPEYTIWKQDAPRDERSF